MDEHEPTAAPLIFGYSRASAEKAGILCIAVLFLARAGSEFAMMRESGSDPQMPIWIMFSAIMLLLWFLAGAVPVWLMLKAWPRRWVAIPCAAALLVWAVAIAHASWQYNEGRRALADAASSHSSPERLSELVHFDGIQAGYELDNRLASNHNTPVAALRELAQKRDQLGTQMCLAKNRNTPPDVLEGLERRP